jgi:Ca2+-transporting ATPase
LKSGLSQKEAEDLLKQFGPNSLPDDQGRHWVRRILEVIQEPMVLLLLAAALLYLVLNQWQEGVLLLVALLFVASISLFQTLRSDNALKALKKVAQSKVQVHRDGSWQTINSEFLVPGDLVGLEEGLRIPADGFLVTGHDVAVNEDVLTGESAPVLKSNGDAISAGTLLVSGSLEFYVEKTGIRTAWGRIGKSLTSIQKEKTILQLQVERFVSRMATIGFLAFLLLLGVQYYRSHEILTSLLQGLTIAMALIPEEIPVAFASFMALGAVKMGRFGVLTREPQTVESLGAATVICTDKTGTLTQKGMEVVRIIGPTCEAAIPSGEPLPEELALLVRIAQLASEEKPFNEMEKAIRRMASGTVRPPMVFEYPLEGKPPMMTHIFQTPQGNLAAGKGGIETVLSAAKVDPEVQLFWKGIASDWAEKGYRILAVAQAFVGSEPFPSSQQEFSWQFLGLLVLQNPPKPNAHHVVDQFLRAGIQVRMVTGDSPETAVAIASQVGIPQSKNWMTGSEVLELSKEDLKMKIKGIFVFARMFPEAKLKLVEALKQDGEVVAMTGDGVNDGPALKAAHIGVAMGKRGTEVARQAASLILMEDDLGGMVHAIALGRQMYQNLKKAVSYIITIHIPLILVVSFPLIIGWRDEALFWPLHVIFFELVMGPTCSIAFENEPPDPDYMLQPPRVKQDSFLSSKELIRSSLQGVLIAVVLMAYVFFYLKNELGEEVQRTHLFVALMASNLWLTLSARSGHLPFWKSYFRPNSILMSILAGTLLLMGLFLAWQPARSLFGLAGLSGAQMVMCFLVGFFPVALIELVKILRFYKIVP